MSRNAQPVNRDWVTAAFPLQQQTFTSARVGGPRKVEAFSSLRMRKLTEDN
jgi:hypothetical protein